MKKLLIIIPLILLLSVNAYSKEDFKKIFGIDLINTNKQYKLKLNKCQIINKKDICEYIIFPPEPNPHFDSYYLKTDQEKREIIEIKASNIFEGKTLDFTNNLQDKIALKLIGKYKLIKHDYDSFKRAAEEGKYSSFNILFSNGWKVETFSIPTSFGGVYLGITFKKNEKVTLKGF